MRVLLIQSWLGPGFPLPIFPLGLAYVATALAAAGRECRIVDPNVESEPMEAVGAAIREFAPEVIGLSLRNIDNQF